MSFGSKKTFLFCVFKSGGIYLRIFQKIELDFLKI